MGGTYRSKSVCCEWLQRKNVTLGVNDQCLALSSSDNVVGWGIRLIFDISLSLKKKVIRLWTTQSSPSSVQQSFSGAVRSWILSLLKISVAYAVTVLACVEYVLIRLSHNVNHSFQTDFLFGWVALAEWKSMFKERVGNWWAAYIRSPAVWRWQIRQDKICYFWSVKLMEKP